MNFNKLRGKDLDYIIKFNNLDKIVEMPFKVIKIVTWVFRRLIDLTKAYSYSHRGMANWIS